MDKIQMLSMIQAYTGVGIGLIIGLGALGACIGVGIMCSRFLHHRCGPRNVLRVCQPAAGRGDEVRARKNLFTAQGPP